MKYLNEFQNLVVQIIFFSLHQKPQFCYLCFSIKLEQNKKKLSREFLPEEITELELRHLALKLSVIATADLPISH